MVFTINTFGVSQRHQSFLVVNRAFPAVIGLSQRHQSFPVVNRAFPAVIGLSQRHQSFLVVNRTFPAVKRKRNVKYETVDDRSHLLDGTFRVHSGFSMDVHVSRYSFRHTPRTRKLYNTKKTAQDKNKDMLTQRVAVQPCYIKG